MIAANLPALQVVVPLLGAPLCLLLRRPGPAWILSVAITAACLFMSAALLHQVLVAGPISYPMGNWAPPWGIEYRVDVANAFVLFLVSLIGTVVMLYAGTSAPDELPPARVTLFYAACLLNIAGVLGIAITGDAFNLFVFMEIASLSSYILVSQGRDRRALTAAFQYLVMGTIGATFILIGVGMLYMVTGTLNMADLAARLPEASAGRTVQSAFAFLLVGISLKLALFPLHLWLPNAYTFAPSVASALLAATSTKVALYVLIRFIFTILGPEYAFGVMPLGDILVALGLVAVFAGSFVAIFQDNVKRLFAYSSVAQIGYMVLGLGLGSLTGLTATILHLFNHALMKGGLFLALGALLYRTGGVGIEDLQGMGRKMPWTMAAIVVGGLSLVGVPLTVGFVSKWYLVLAALEQGRWVVALLVLLGSLLALVYIWRLVEAAYFKPPADRNLEAREAPPGLLVPTWALIVACIWFGIDTNITIASAGQAAMALWGIGQ